MANNIFPNDINSAPLCTICSHKVIDDASRSITKLICGHFFHTDCIGVEFNIMGLMICPNCQVIQEDGNWLRLANYEEHLEGKGINLLNHANKDAYNGAGASHMSFTRNEMNINNVPLNDAPPNIRHNTIQINNGRNIFSHTFVDASPIVQQNEWSQRLHIPPPPPITLELVGQMHVSASDPNIISNPMRHQASTLYEQSRNNMLPCLELTLATTSTSLGDGRPLPPCQCICCRGSSSRKALKKKM